MQYKRSIFNTIQPYLDKDESLLIIGPRQVGKTTLLKQLALLCQSKGQQYFMLNLEDPEYLKLLDESPKKIFDIFPLDLKQRTVIFVDEVQYLADPTNFLKYIFDEYAGKIKLVVTGSSAFYLDSKFNDSLVGRKKIFTLLTLSFREFLHFRNLENIAQSLDRLTISETDQLRPLFYEYAAFGGYPKVVLSSLENKKEVLQDLVYSYVKKDIFEAGVRRDDQFFLLLKILAEQTGGMLNVADITRSLNVSKAAVDNYLAILQKTFHIYLVRPYFTSPRKEVRKMPKVFFTDLGLRNFLVGNLDFLLTRSDRGQVLENLVFRQLLEKFDQEDVRYWRTLAHNEVDFVLAGKEALEVKFKGVDIRKSSLSNFSQKYPDISSSAVVMEKTDRVAIRQYYPWEI